MTAGEAGGEERERAGSVGSAGRMRREQHLEPQSQTDRSRVMKRDGYSLADAREGV